jgi:hypothetical protein
LVGSALRFRQRYNNPSFAPARFEARRGAIIIQENDMSNEIIKITGELTDELIARLREEGATVLKTEDGYIITGLSIDEVEKITGQEVNR